MMAEIKNPEIHQGHGCLISSNIFYALIQMKRNNWLVHVVDELLCCTAVEYSSLGMRSNANQVHVIHLIKMDHSILYISILNDMFFIAFQFILSGKNIHCLMDL